MAVDDAASVVEWGDAGSVVYEPFTSPDGCHAHEEACREEENSPEK